VTLHIHNIRRGLATNSSSSHSLLFLPKGKGIPDADPDGGYGWNYFTCASKEAKLHYLAVTLLQNLESFYPNLYTSSLSTEGPEKILYDKVHEYTGVMLEGDDRREHVDHQSVMTFPSDWPATEVDREFFSDFCDWFLDDMVAVLGGNDNDGDEHPNRFDGTLERAILPLESHPKNYACRKDPVYGFWTMFDRVTGNKTRLSFTPGVAPQKAPDKASTPELVDISLTTQCPFVATKPCGQFCYQGAKVKGEYASLASLVSIADALAQMRVFEIALGGGEPTTHPQFIEILKAFRDRGVVPNFTTKNLAWVKSHNFDTAMSFAGAFAYSITSADEVNELVKVKVKAIDKRLGKQEYGASPRAVLQLVMGSVDRDEFEQIVLQSAMADFRLTLLGYKSTGYGAHFTPIDYSWWLKSILSVMARKKILEDNHYVQVSVDTALAAQYENEIKASGIPAWCFHTKEGGFSCFIDAVRPRIAPSSFCDESKYIALESLDARTIQDAFARIEPQ